MRKVSATHLCPRRLPPLIAIPYQVSTRPPPVPHWAARLSLHAGISQKFVPWPRLRNTPPNFKACRRLGFKQLQALPLSSPPLLFHFSSLLGLRRRSYRAVCTLRYLPTDSVAPETLLRRLGPRFLPRHLLWALLRRRRRVRRPAAPRLTSRRLRPLTQPLEPGWSVPQLSEELCGIASYRR